MKKILHVLNTTKFSGAENVVCTIIKNEKKNYEMIYCSPNGSIKDKLNAENINFYPLKKLSYFELKKAIKEIKPDVIHAHDNRATILTSFFAKKYKVISHIHGNNIIMNSLNLKTILFNLCSKNIKRFIWVSDSSLDNYYFKKCISNKSTVLYNVVDQNEIKKKAKQYQCEEKYDLIFIGRLGYPKNPERLIEIIRLLKEKLNHIRVAIVGDGSERMRIEELINEYGLNENIKMYGFQANPFPILNNSKILIMTSIYEGTPMCALEAQSLGKLIVATPVDGLKKIVKNDINGYLSDENDVIVNKIVEYLTSEKYQNIESKIFKEFKKYNDINEYLKVIEKIYEE